MTIVMERYTQTDRVLHVGDKVVNVEDHTTFSDVEKPLYRRYKARYAQREKERERHKEYLYS